MSKNDYFRGPSRQLVVVEAFGFFLLPNRSDWCGRFFGFCLFDEFCGASRQFAGEAAGGLPESPLNGNNCAAAAAAMPAPTDELLLSDDVLAA